MMQAPSRPESREDKVDRTVLGFTVKRGKKVPVAKVDYFWELSKTLHGIQYTELWRSLQRLKDRGLVTMEMTGASQWLVRPTSEAVQITDAWNTKRNTMQVSVTPMVACPQCQGEMPRGARLCGKCALPQAWSTF